MKRPDALLLALLFALLLGGAGFAQEAAPAQDLVRATLGRDIASAGYYELLAWCRELALSDAGAAPALRERLYAFFQLSPEAPPASAPKRVLTIQSARSSESFTVQPVDEDNVLLQGDVVVEVQEQDAVHRIRAQRILLNQSANLLTAEGDLEYVFKRGEREDVFRGERLTFNVDTWEGAFFGGGLQGDREVAGKKMRFFFLADSISKLAGSTVVMDRGVITSCDVPVDPHYHIRARKIWVLAPGEWAIANAVLYVGRVPVVYLPFFFRPGDEFFFHPAIGYKDREGNFLQTTTYLIGQKARSPSAFSVLAATEEKGAQAPREIKGLFLRQVEGEQPPVTENRFLKVFLDFYSRLGGFAGVSADFPPRVSFRSGVGFSRNIYPRFVNPWGTVYTPWKPGGDYQSVWNQAWLLGLRVPFRYGLDGKWNLPGAGARVSGKFEYYSDPVFARDFYSRSEETSLSRLLGTDPTGATVQVSEGVKGSMSWEVNSQLDFPKLRLGQYLNRLSVPYLNANLYWQKKQILPAPADPDVDPSAYFFYPVNLKLPNASMLVSGVLFSVASAQTSAAVGKSQVPHDLRPPAILPVGEPAETPPPKQPAVSTLRRPEPKEDLPPSTGLTPLSFTLSYQARPTVVVEQNFNTEAWNQPAEIAYDLDFTSLESFSSGSLDWALKVYDNLFAFTGSLGLSGNYRTRLRQSYGDASEEGADWTDLVLGDYRYNQIQLKNLLSASLFPFYTDPRFRTTKLGYSINWLLFKYSLDPSSTYSNPVYLPQPPTWDKNTVSQHQAEAVFGWQPGSRVNSLSLTTQLPPLDTIVTLKAEAYVWLLKTAVNSVFNEAIDAWSLTIQETLEFSAKTRISEEIQLDLMRGKPVKSITSLNWGGFSSSFIAQEITGGEFGPGAVTAAFKMDPRTLFFWRQRSRLEIFLNTAWNMNLYTNEAGIIANNLTFSFTMKYYLYKFLELSFTSNSYNGRTYQYFPGFTPQWVNPLTDLLKSFNFFDIQDRKESAFKLKNISFELIHHLHDWDLTLRYDGKPVIETIGGKAAYTWDDSFSILLQWLPIPELRSNLRSEEGKLILRG